MDTFDTSTFETHNDIQNINFGTPVEGSVVRFIPKAFSGKLIMRVGVNVNINDDLPALLPFSVPNTVVVQGSVKTVSIPVNLERTTPMTVAKWKASIEL